MIYISGLNMTIDDTEPVFYIRDGQAVTFRNCKFTLSDRVRRLVIEQQAKEAREAMSKVDKEICDWLDGD